MPSLKSQVPDLILRSRASGVSKDEWHQWGFMVRDGAIAPPHHEGTFVARSEAFLLARRQIGRICFILRRRCGRGLRSGTSLERNAPESLTLPETRYVHRNISRWHARGDTRSSLQGLHKRRCMAEIVKGRSRIRSGQESTGFMLVVPMSRERGPACSLAPFFTGSRRAKARS